MKRFIPKVNRLILISFLLLAAATPLIFSPFNTELFEVPKMHFVYAISIIILFLTVIKFVINEKIIIPKSPVLGLFSLFVIVQIFSYFSSIDKFTSIYGYPTRLNGGLLSQFSYLIIFSAALIHLSQENLKRILMVLVISAFAVSLWGIPSYFGYDPSCVILTGDLTSTCWKKEFQPTLRIFSTFGQPNWLASYLVLILPIAIGLLLTSKKRAHKFFLTIAAIAMFTAILLTSSRSGFIGLSVGLIIFLILTKKALLKRVILIGASFLILTILFGTPFTPSIGELISSREKPTKQLLTIASSTKPAQTSLESGGTESGTIRLIVWQGALNIFKNSPILGTGPETFVSSYYLFRPDAHNQTSEWEFFYNKAHNEYLNHLANTGILGLISLIGFLTFALYTIFRNRKKSTLAVASFASIIGYLATIFFGFSVVATQTALLLIIAFGILLGEDNSKKEILIKLNNNVIFPIVIFVSLLGIMVFSFVFRSFVSNVYEKKAEKSKNLNSAQTLKYYAKAIQTNPSKNPYQIANYSTALAQSISNADDQYLDQLRETSAKFARDAIEISPQNFIVNQRVTRTYALLANNNPKYGEAALDSANNMIRLAPNYPISFLTLAKINIILKQYTQASQNIEKTLELKSDYLEARQLLDQVDEQISK